MLKKDNSKEIRSSNEAPPRPSLTIDWDYYLAFLEGSDVSEEQKRELIETLWSIVVSFVDLGFGVHPLQQALPEECEQLPDMSEILASDLSNVISSKHQFSKTEFSKAATPNSHGRGKGNES